MGVELLIRPISNWPIARAARHRVSRFQSTWSDTVELLERELRHLGAKRAVFELEVDEADIRLDGWIRATARPHGPGVILSTVTRHGPLRCPCDTFSHWQDNVRAIALSLSALRAVDRYGVSKHGEQYRGWKGLPAPSSDEFATADAAAVWLAAQTGALARAILESASDRDAAYRAAAIKLHPDRGGDEAEFKRLQAAIQLLRGTSNVGTSER